MKSIGWIGVGIMGKPMVRNLQKAGYTLHIYARNREKVADVIQEGAIFHDTIGDCAQGRDAVITMVGFPKDVEEVYFAPGNILDRADPGTYLIDMTTTSPTLAQRIYQEGAARRLRVLDAPVTGGDSGARAGTLSILVGGDQADFDACPPIFQAMGTNITYFGPAGCGQHAKMANQIMIAGTLSGVCEALTYAKAEGLDVTCETAPHYLLMDETMLQEDGRFKMNPPLRDKSDREALLEGLADGTIDMIATDHAPHSAEEKGGGLEKSAMGIVGLETAFPLLYTYLVKPGVISFARLMELLHDAPCRRFGIAPATGFTVFDLNRTYPIDPAEFLSMGRATPFAGWSVQGRCLLTAMEGRAVWYDKTLLEGEDAE